MYDRRTKRWACAAIRQVAQERDYFDDETERQLASMEATANQALDSLRAGHLPTSEGRGSLALYISTMLMRVPRRRRKAEALFPSVRDQTMSEVRGEVEKVAAESGRQSQLVKRLRELDEIEL